MIKNINKKEIIKGGVALYDKHFPNDKHTTKKQKIQFVKFFIELYELKNRKGVK
jgi:hypothetical protein|tara:strand:- start:378 stop:539 length:162 start_codon:yes stop_codon:yes gene_type:complete